MSQQTATELASLPEGQAPAVPPQAYANSAVQGNLSASWVNNLFAAAGFPAPFAADQLAEMKRGISYYLFGKVQNFTDLGSRYQVVDSLVQIYAGYQYQAYQFSKGESGRDQAFYDQAQQGFLQEALEISRQAGNAWRVVASSSPYTPILLNLSDAPEGAKQLATGTIKGERTPDRVVPQGIPESLAAEVLVNADELSGFPTARQGMIDSFAEFDAVIVSGDIHASMLGENLAENGKRVIDFTVPSTSSSAFRNEFSRGLGVIENLTAPGYRAAFNDPSIQFEFNGKEEFLEQIDRWIVYNSRDLSYLNSYVHGYLVMVADADSLTGEFREIDVANVKIDRIFGSRAGLDAVFSRRPYTVTKSDEGLTVTPQPMTLVLSKRFDQIKVGERIVIPWLATVEGMAYQVLYATELEGMPWTPLPITDYIAVDGALLQEGRIRGNGNGVSVVFRIPEALADSETAFFRGAPVP